MKKLFFVLMAVAAIVMTGTFAGCNDGNDPEVPENRNPVVVEDLSAPDN